MLLHTIIDHGEVFYTSVYAPEYCTKDGVLFSGHNLSGGFIIDRIISTDLNHYLYYHDAIGKMLPKA